MLHACSYFATCRDTDVLCAELSVLQQQRRSLTQAAAHLGSFAADTRVSQRLSPCPNDTSRIRCEVTRNPSLRPMHSE